MRILDQAIQQNFHKKYIDFSNEQTWETFEKSACEKGLWIFGVGEGAELYLDKYDNRFIVNGVIDNDIHKQGHLAKDYIKGNHVDVLSSVKVCALPDIVNKDNAVVLVTSVRYFDEIIDQLNSYGIRNIYSLLHMEANRSDYSPAEDDEKKLYAKKCLSNPVQKNKILLSRDESGGHGRQILNYLLKRKDEFDLDLVWVDGRQDLDVPEGIRVISASDWEKYIYELETAYIWLFGDMIPEFAIKRKEQKYIQLKHWASLTLKKFYMDLDRFLEVPAIRSYYRHNSDAMDYVFVGSEFDEASCRSGFDFKGECIHVGSPRTDVLFKSGIREKVFSKYGLRDDVHVLLYAPTFRSKDENTVIGKMGSISLNFGRLHKSLVKRFGGEWIIFLRVHPDVAIESRKVKKTEFVIDATYYPDAEELVAASDVLITDYSSIIFEPAFVGKAVFCYAPDKNEYISKDRELLLDYDKLPFPLAESNDQLEKEILEFDEVEYEKELNQFLTHYNVNEDGHAAERAGAFIEKIIAEG